MGLFDDLLRNAVGGEAHDPAAQSQGLVEGLLDLLGSGGVDGLARNFERKGLGAEATSWIGTGANRPVSPTQITEALGASQVEGLGRRAGLGASASAAAIAAILPALIDKLTPDGQAPSGAQLRQRGQTLLGGIFGASAGGGGKGAPPGGGKKPDFSNVKSGSSSAPSTPPVSAPPPQQETYTVAKGDSLSKIAKKVYGDANQWKKIFEANKDQIKDPDLIQPGWKLRIPR
jgi:uncharacterized protein YidB (DUF937 family)